MLIRSACLLPAAPPFFPPCPGSPHRPCSLRSYTRPQLAEEADPPQLHIEGGRHPVVELLLQGGGRAYVPNDTHLQVRRGRRGGALRWLLALCPEAGLCGGLQVTAGRWAALR